VVDEVDERAPDERPQDLGGPVGDDLGPGKARLTAMARVTAGLMWAPLTPPATYTPKATASDHPQAISSQSPLAAKISSPRPDWFRAATAMATTPSPKAISTNVPRNSASSSPHTVARKRAIDRAIANHLSGGRAPEPPSRG
jgi:hypothetical protein